MVDRELGCGDRDSLRIAGARHRRPEGLLLSAKPAFAPVTTGVTESPFPGFPAGGISSTSSIAQIFTGSYTGNGAVVAGSKIVTVPFLPKLIVIIPVASAGTTVFLDTVGHNAIQNNPAAGTDGGEGYTASNVTATAVDIGGLIADTVLLATMNTNAATYVILCIG